MVIRYYHGASMDELSSDYVYDDLGRVDVVRSFRPGGPELTTVTSYSLQGRTDSVVACFDDQFVFMQGLSYDCESDLSSHDPQYAGLVTLKNETWFSSGSAPVTDVKCYGYDYAGRLTSEKEGLSGMSYTYDSRGNMLTYGIAPSITPRNTFDYSGDRLTCPFPMTPSAG